MLESTVWRQYHSENNFREKIAEKCSLEILDLLPEDKDLYAILKAKLTKKELKLFAMDSAKIAEGILKGEFNYDDEALEKAKYKLYKKLKQDKTRLYFRASNTFSQE